MAVKQVFVAPGQTPPQVSPHVAWFLSFTGTSFSAQLEMNVAGDWLPVGAAITAASTTPTFVGRAAGDMSTLSWRWNITAVTSGTLTAYLA